MNKLDFLTLFDKVCAAENALIIGHRRRSGDCVGSAAALTHLLHSMGRRAEVMFPDPVPKRLDFLLAELSARAALPRSWQLADYLRGRRVSRSAGLACRAAFGAGISPDRPSRRRVCVRAV